MTAATLINHLPRLPKEPYEIITDGLKEGGGQFGKIGFHNRARNVSLKLSCINRGDLCENKYTIEDFERTLRSRPRIRYHNHGGGHRRTPRGRASS